MNQEVVLSLSPADSRTFHGRAYSRLMGVAESEEPLKIYLVRFEAGARTNWHSHSGTQILVVTSGRCRYQRAGEPAREAGAGQSVRFEPDVRHWHGGSAEAAAEHIAVNLDGGETTWMEEVTDHEFRGEAPESNPPSRRQR
jgi:4-carboxymuconolactone decarboxylase